MNKIRLRLIAEWRQAWRFWSVRLSGLGVTLLTTVQVLTTTWNSMPADLRDAVPYTQYIAIALCAAGTVARIVAQPVAQEKIQQKMEQRNA